jgi:hypothetical protein
VDRTDRGEELAKSLATHESLVAFTKQVVFNNWDSEEAIYKNTAWRKLVGDVFPAIVLQSASYTDGTADVVFFATGDHTPIGDELAEILSTQIMAYADVKGAGQHWGPWRPDGGCPVPRPRTPEPTPPPADTPLVPTITVPDVVVKAPGVDIEIGGEEEEEEPGSLEIPVLAYLLIFACGAAGIYKKLQKESE